MSAQTELVLQTIVKGTEKATKALDDVKGSLDGIGKSATEASKGTQTFTKKLENQREGLMALGVASGLAFYGITAGIKGSVNEAVKFENALVGLKSIADGTGKDFEKAKGFIQEFTKDGLITAGDAATSLKSLFQRGFSLEESVVLLNRFKDSASFGRQSALGLGEAVRGAAEGLKNENSMLVDNAGVTKNVAKMWEEYANKIGVKTTAMTLDQKREAEYQGILAETKFQVGDATKYAEGYAGAVAKQDAATLALQQTIGTALLPAMTKITEAMTKVLVPIAGWIKEHPKLSAYLILGTTAILGITVAITALGLAIPGIVLGVKALGIIIGGLTGPIGIAIIAITALVTAGLYMYNNWEQIKSNLSALWNQIKIDITTIFDGIFQYLSGIFGEIKTIIGVSISYIGSIMQAGLNGLKIIWETTWGFIKSFLEGIFISIGLILGLGIQLFTGDFSGFLKNIKAIWNFGWTAIKDFLSIILESIKLIATTVWTAIQIFLVNSMNVIKTGIITGWTVISTGISNILTAIKSFIVTSWEGIKEFIINTVETLGMFFGKEGREKIYGGITGMFTGIGEFVSNLFNGIVDGIRSALNIVIGLINSAISKANSIPGVNMPTVPQIAGARATGGPVSGGSSYLVGERGPEIFTPGISGSITPNNKLGGSSIVINISGVFGRDAVDQIGDAIVGRLKQASYI